MRFFQFCHRIWNHRKILRLIVFIMTYLKKVFQFHFLKNINWSILLNSVVLYRSGEGDVEFLLKCYARCPICRTSFLVHKSRYSINALSSLTYIVETAHIKTTLFCGVHEVDAMALLVAGDLGIFCAFCQFRQLDQKKAEMLMAH